MSTTKCGSLVLCENNYLVAVTNRDLKFGDVRYSSAFEYQPNQIAPTYGQPDNPTCYCGAIWFNLKTNCLVNCIQPKI